MEKRRLRGFQPTLLLVLVGVSLVSCSVSRSDIATVVAKGGVTSVPTTKAEVSGITPIEGPLKVTVVYDNNEFAPELRTDWGFACVVEAGEQTILFDTGGNGELLLDNMDKLGLEMNSIDAIVLSHIHGDHTNGLQRLLDLD